MSVKVSIIVPIYKVEQYLERAVESLLGQTLDNVEIILVDDGSPDGCGAMCDAYAEKYPFISVVHKENGGLSSARNAGMKIARGEYIGFVDPDDYILPDMFEKLYASAIENNADFVGCGYMRKWLGEGEMEHNHSNLPAGVYGRDVILGKLAVHIFGDEFHLYQRDTVGYAWMNIYRGDIIRKNGIEFSSERKYYHEDEVFLLDFVRYAHTAAFVDEPLYIYCVRKNSLINCFRKNMWEMYKALIEKYHEFALKYDFTEEYNRLIPATELNFSRAAVLNECRRGCPNSFATSVRVIKEICNDPMVIRVLASGAKRECNLSDKVCLFLMKRKMPITICICYRIFFVVTWFTNGVKRKMTLLSRKIKSVFKKKEA